MLPIQRQLFPLLPNKSPPHYTIQTHTCTTASRTDPSPSPPAWSRNGADPPSQTKPRPACTSAPGRCASAGVGRIAPSATASAAGALPLRLQEKRSLYQEGEREKIVFKDLLEAAISAKRQRMGRIHLGRGQSDSSVYVPRYIPYTVSLLLCHYPYTNNTWLIQQWLLLFVSLFLF